MAVYARESPSYPKPNTARGLRQFLDFMDSYRSCIPDCDKIQAPFNDFFVGNIKGEAKLHWASESEAAFQKVKYKVAHKFPC